MEAVNPKVPNPDLENMMQIALASLGAGEGLPDIAESRGMEAVPYKYGMHLGNWTDGGSSGLEREMEATLPTSLVYMDNVKGQPLNLQLERLKAKGVKPILEYRPYFAPSGGTSGAAIENYANGAAIRLRDEYLPQPHIAEAYGEGRLTVKLFNETNIGGEGFARGRAGFADALRCWKQARGIVKASFPNAKFMSIANTPGNDDVYFSGDALNLPYWYHGAEAAKANPTASEIQAAINSCPFREMFQLCDVIGIHVYAQDERQTRGDLQTWYGRRHEQALKFLQPYIAQGKKMIISEWDCGYDQQPNPQQARAELCVWWLANVVGPNAAILTTNHWWNSDDGEGATTWEKHQTRKGGEFRPVVNAVANFRSGATVPPVEPPVDPDEPPPSTSLPPRVTIDLPTFVTITNAVAAPGERFWRAVRVERKRGDANGGQHHIYHWQPHNAAVMMVVGVEATPVVLRIPHDKPANEPAANHPMSGGGNRYWSRVEGLGITKSDQINGMTMFENQHESFHITWELVTQPIGDVPVFDMTTRFIQLARAEFGTLFEDLRATLPKHPTLRFDPIDSRLMRYLCFHHTATPINSTWKRIAEHHVNTRGWAGIGYHLGIRQGKVALLADLDTQRAHVENRNDEALGCAWMGNSDTVPVPPTDIDLMKRLVKVTDILYVTDKILTDHSSMLPNHTVCPGSDLKRIVPTLRAPVTPPVVIQWEKVVWQGEDAMRSEEREGRLQNAEWIRVNWVEPAIRERDK